MIFYISFANLKNFGFLRFHQHSRYLHLSQSVGFAVKSMIEMLFSFFSKYKFVNFYSMFTVSFF